MTIDAPRRLGNAPPIRVFLSYPRARKDALRELEGAYRPLVQGGAAVVWYDEGDLVAGEAWRTRIEQELARADIVVALVCEELLASTECLRELELARSRARICPTLIARCDFHKHALIGGLQLLGPATPFDELKAASRDENQFVSQRRDWLDRWSQDLQRVVGAVRDEASTFGRYYAGLRGSAFQCATACAEELQRSGVDCDPAAIVHFVSDVVACKDANLVHYACRTLTESLFLARWIELEPDLDKIWLLLDDLLALASQGRDAEALLALHRFFAEAHAAFTVRGADVRSPLANWVMKRNPSARLTEPMYLAVSAEGCADPPRGPEAPLLMGFGSVSPVSGRDAVLFSAGANVCLLEGPDLRVAARLCVSAGGSVIASPRGDVFLSVEGTRLVLRSTRTLAPRLRLVGRLAEDDAPGADHAFWSPDGSGVYAVHRSIIRLWHTGNLTGGTRQPEVETRMPSIMYRPAVKVGRFVIAAVNSFDAEEFAPGLLVLDDATLTVRAHVPVPGENVDGNITLAAVHSLRRVLVFTKTDLWSYDLDTGLTHLRRLDFLLQRWDASRPANLPVALTGHEDRLYAWDGSAVHVLQTATGKAEASCSIRLAGDVDGIVVGPSDDVILFYREEGLSCLPTRSITASRSAKPEAVCLKANFFYKHWRQDTSGRAVARPRGNQFLVRDLDTLGVRAAVHRNKIAKDFQRLEANGSTTYAVITDDGALHLWNSIREAEVMTVKACDEKPNVSAGCFVGPFLVIALRGDHHIPLLAIGIGTNGEQPVLWRTTASDIHWLRNIATFAPFLGGVLVASDKYHGGLYLWRDPIRDLRLNDGFIWHDPRSRSESAARPIVVTSPPFGMDEPVVVDPRAAGWTTFLRGSHGELYGYNHITWTIAVFRPTQGGAGVEMETLATGVQMTNWHFSSPYLCIASNYFGAVFLVDVLRRTTELAAIGNGVAFARAFGEQTNALEVFPVGDTPPLRFERRLQK